MARTANDATLRAMQRRTLLTVGLVAGTLLALVGGALALMQPARRDGKLGRAARLAMTAVARAVLGPLLPQAAEAQATALQAHVGRVEAAIAGLPPSLQNEVDELLTIVASAPGRLALVGLADDWHSASDAQVTLALQGMRESSLALRQQAFHALRDISNGAYFADESTWRAIGYPGPRVL